MSGATEATDWNCTPIEVRVRKITAKASQREAMSAHYITAGGGREPAPVRVRATKKRSTCKSSRSPLQDCLAQLSHLLLGQLQPIRHPPSRGTSSSRW